MILILLSTGSSFLLAVLKTPLVPVLLGKSIYNSLQLD